jgi:hypothetical protein
LDDIQPLTTASDKDVDARYIVSQNSERTVLLVFVQETVEKALRVGPYYYTYELAKRPLKI